MKVAPVQRPLFVAGVDYYSGDLAQMLGLPGRLREDDIAPIGKILATSQSRCAQRDSAAETPGLRFTFIAAPTLRASLRWCIATPTRFR